MLESEKTCAKFYKITKDPSFDLEKIKSLKQWLEYIFTEKQGFIYIYIYTDF